MLLGVYTPLFFLSSDTICKIVEQTDHWCQKNIGRSDDMVIEVTKQKFWDYPCYGQYDENNKVLYVFTNRCDDIKDLIKAFLHEYTHYTQDLSQYDSLLNIYGYDDHPQEIEANETAKLYDIVWRKIKNKI